VLGRATFYIDGGRSAPARARQIVAVTIGVVLSEEAAYQAGLLTSEVVNNSVMHGHATEEEEIELVVSWSVERVRLEVTDRGPGFQASAPDPERPGGWGLALVESMSDRWGIERGKGTRVWFELARDGADVGG